MQPTRTRPCVVVVGAGFGGLFAVKSLAPADVDILLIDQNNYHTFIPLLYQVAAAELEPEEIAYPVRTIARRIPNLRFAMEDVLRVDLESKMVYTNTGAHNYDYLVLAAGSVTNFFGLATVEEHAFGIKDLPESVALRNHILERFEMASHEQDPHRRQALLTFVIVGGGPTGVEFSATLSELIRGILIKDYPELRLDPMRILLLEAADRLLPSLQPDLGAYAQRVLESKNVEVVLGAKVIGATAGSVELDGADAIPTHTLVWTAGVKANALVTSLGVELARAGRVVVTDGLHLPGHPEVFVVGDMAYVEQEDGSPVPQVAPAAIQQAQVAADNIRRHLAGQPYTSFRYQDKGTMVTIGRAKGLAAIGKWSIRGFFAWLAWLAVHIIRLIGFRNRLYVLTSWAWSYVFQDRIRLILKTGAKSGAQGGAARASRPADTEGRSDPSGGKEADERSEAGSTGKEIT